MINNFDQLLEHALTVQGKRVVVVFPNNEETFSAIEEACAIGLADFILIGNEEVITKRLEGKETTKSKIKIFHQENSSKALQAAIEMMNDGMGDILMKGGVDTSTMMKAVLQDSAGMKTGRLLSDIFIMEFPQREANKFIMITDGGMSLAPDLKNKMELIKNAVEVAHALGNILPKIAVLSATEFVLPNLQSTLDAAA